MSLNRVQLIGNLTRDPEVRNTSGGRAVVNYSVATSRKWTDAAGQAKDQTEFHNIVVFGKLAEICAQYLRKGSKVYVDGRLQTSNWEGEDGVKRYRTEIILENMIMLDRKGESSGGSFGMDRQPAGIDAPAGEDFPVTEQSGSMPEKEVAVEDLPF